MTTSCPSQLDLQSFLDDSLSPDQESGIIAHVESCAQCRQTMDTLSGKDSVALEPVRPSRTVFRPAFRDRLARAAPPMREPHTWMKLSAAGDTPGTFSAKKDTLVIGKEGHPSRMGGYEILEELGKGGMGVVYLARDTRLGRLVALKMIRGGDWDDVEQQARFLAEAQSIARLQHPHIVQLYEMGTLEGRLYCALEYVPGGSLAKHLEGRPLPAIPTAALLEPLARAVHHAHQHNIVHRDLKPANVLLAPKTDTLTSKPGTTAKTEAEHFETLRSRSSDWANQPLARELTDAVPKVTDFGLAKRLDVKEGLTQTGVILGTPSYMAPEQARSENEKIGPAADIFALGVILYECLTGRPPFLGATALETIDLLQNEEPLPPSRLGRNIPRDLETICLKCLQKEPPRRYPTAEALAEDLGRFLRGEPILARPVPTHERLWRWCRRNPLAASFLVTLTAALVVMAMLVWWALDERNHAARNAQLAEEKRKEADQQRREAIANFDQAKEAVDNCFRLAQNHELFQGDDQRDRRKLLLEQARPFYEKFVQQRSDDLAILEGQADLLWKLGYIYGEIGPWEKAVAAYRNAGVVHRKLLVQRPQDHALKSRLAMICNNLGLTYRLQMQGKEALPCYQEAEALQEQLMKDQPQDADHPVALARTWRNLSVLHRDLGNAQEVRIFATKSMDLERRFLEQHPTDDRHRYGLATSLSILGMHFQDHRQFESARTYYQEARQQFERLTAAHPTRMDYLGDLGGVWQGLGQMYYQQGQWREGIDAYSQARRMYMQVFAAQPRWNHCAIALGNVCVNLGNFHLETGQPLEALALYNQAERDLREVLRREPKAHNARHILSGVYAGRGTALKELLRFTAAAADWRRVAGPAVRDVPAEHRQLYRESAWYARGEEAWLTALAASLVARGSLPCDGAGHLAPWLLWVMPLAN